MQPTPTPFLRWHEFAAAWHWLTESLYTFAATSLCAATAATSFAFRRVWVAKESRVPIKTCFLPVIWYNHLFGHVIGSCCILLTGWTIRWRWDTATGLFWHDVSPAPCKPQSTLCFCNVCLWNTVRWYALHRTYRRMRVCCVCVMRKIAIDTHITKQTHAWTKHWLRASLIYLRFQLQTTT